MIFKRTSLTAKNIVFTDESVKRQITDSISENLTDSDLERTKFYLIQVNHLFKSKKVFQTNNFLWFNQIVFLSVQFFEKLLLKRRFLLTAPLLNKLSERNFLNKKLFLQGLLQEFGHVVKKMY